MRTPWLMALRAVIRAPSVIEHDLASLLTPVPEAVPTHAARAESTVRLAHRILGQLGRFRPSAHRWRATCLYRSAVECLVLRELGFPARVVIGARIDDSSGTVAAHAWVECEGIRCASTRGEASYEVLSIPSAAAAL